MEKGTFQPISFAVLPFVVNSLLSVEKLRVAAQVRQTHLKNSQREDPETDALVAELTKLEEFIDGRIVKLIEAHPAFPWFSKVKGIGRDNIAKVIGLIDITKAPHISSLWKFSGYHVDENGKAPKRVAGAGKLEYNSRLRSMLWRVGGSLLKAGIRYYCTKCGEQRPPASETEELKCAKCGGKEFKPKSISKFAEYYHEQKNLYYVKFYNRGVKIVKASELPKDEEGKRYEPADMISEGHIHAMALRKMLKLFLSCLWQVWRQAEGLPLTEPYAKAKAGHPHVIDPWSMIDKPAKKVG